MFSSGEDVRCIGMMRLNILEMLQKVLELEPKVLLTHFDINRSKILSILQVFYTLFRCILRLTHGTISYITLFRKLS